MGVTNFGLTLLHGLFFEEGGWSNRSSQDSVERPGQIPERDVRLTHQQEGLPLRRGGHGTWRGGIPAKVARSD